MNKSITIWAFGTFAEIAKRGGQQYLEGGNSNIDVINVPDFSSYNDMRMALDTALAHGPDYLPNIALLDVYQLQNILEKYPDALVPVDSILNVRDFLAGAINQLVFEGEIYGIPCVVEPVGLYYKVKMSKEILDSEMENLTWDEAFAMSDQLRENDKYFMSYSTNLPEILLQSSGNYFYDDNFELSSKGVLEVFKLLDEMRMRDIFLPQQNNEENIIDLLSHDDVFSTMGQPWLIPFANQIAEETDTEWRLTNIPKNDQFPFNVCLGGYAWVVFSMDTLEERDEIENFVKEVFISNTDLDLILAESNLVPAKEAAIQRLSELEGNPYFDNQNVVESFAQLAEGVPLVHFNDYTQAAVQVLNDLGKLVVKGKIIPEEATERFDEELEKIKDGNFGDYVPGSGVVYLTRIEVTKKPNKISYELGEAFNPAGMIVTAYYSNDSSQTVTGYTYSPTGKLYFNDQIKINYMGVQTILPITITANIKKAKKYLYFSERKFFNVEIGNNVCKIDAQFGLPNISRELISLGGEKLPLSLSLVYDSQFRQDSTIYERETGLPNGIRTSYHQVCIEQDGEFFYTDSEINLHIFKPTAAINDIWVDSQGTGLLLERVGSEIKIYDEFGNFSKFDNYGRLYLIHQKITEENSADLRIEYESDTEKITTIIDGMGRITTFDYLQDEVKIKVDENAKIAIKSLEGKLSTVVRYSNGDSELGNEADEYKFNQADFLYLIKASGGEELTLTYNNDNAITQYYINAQQKTCYINYDSKNQKTIITDNKGVEQVISFNAKDLCIGSYQDLDGKPVNIHCVDQESCATFSSTLVTMTDKFIFNESLQLSHSQSVISKELQLEFSDKKFSVFSAMVNASENAENAEATGNLTAELLDSDTGEVLCTLQFNPATEGLQIAAKPFMPLRNGENRYKVSIKTNCTQGHFAFSDVVIAPLFGNTQKLCSNVDIGEGSYTYTNDSKDRVYIMNGGTGVSFDDGKKEENIVLYAEDYLANARNVYKNCGSDGSFVFWYNKKCACKTRVKKATVYFGENGPTLTFDANGVYFGTQKAIFYSFTVGTNSIINITNQNYDSSSFADGFANYYLESDTIISDGAKAVKNTAYYDENFNLHVELKRKNQTEIVQRTEYTVDGAGNTTAVSQKDESDPSKSIDEFYGYDANDYLISTSTFIQNMNSTSKYSYDIFGNVVASTAPNNFTQNLIYDSFGDRLIQLNADIGNQEAVNNIDYAKAQVSKLSEGGNGSAYAFEYESNNANLKSVKINGNEYLHIERSFNYEGSTNDRIETVYANGYRQTDIYDKYGHLIYKRDSVDNPNNTLASYFYADDQYSGWDANSPTESGLEVSANAKLYKVVDECTNTTFRYNYNRYNQLSLITWYGRHEDMACYLSYTPNLLVESEEYANGLELFKVKYEYRSDLNYYSEAKKSTITVGGMNLSAEKSWDNLNRVTELKYLNNDNCGLQIDIGYLSREVNGVGTTDFIGEWRYRQFAGQPSNDRRVDTFEYDVNGNVTYYKIKLGSTSYDIRYEYDSANRLIRENNQHLNKTYTYAYDSNGNMIVKKEYAYTTDVLGTPGQNNDYDADKLTSWDGKSFAYDKCGNPTRYKGEPMTWMRGRLLESYTKSGKKYEYDYDANGERFVKKINGQSTYYDSINGKLIFEERADGTIIYFLYGSDGIIGFMVGGKIYYYAKNIFGDVVALYDYDSGNAVARYAYDAWGNHKVLTPEGNENFDSNFIGNINPIRYRSYYWDDDVKLYYLHTRWYDPEIGRFVNMDQIEYLDPETVNGLNLYAYCSNNPVMYADPMGTSILAALLIGLVVGAVVGAVVGGTVAGVNAYNNGSRGWELFGDILLGGLIGGTVGAAAGGMIGAGGVFLSAGASMIGGSFALVGGGVAALGTAVAGVGTMALGGAMVIGGAEVAIAGLGVLENVRFKTYDRKPAAPRIHSGSRKKAYDKAFFKGGKKEPIFHNGKYGKHFHPVGKYKHWHYYFAIIFSWLFNNEE